MTAGQLLWSFAENIASPKGFSVGEWTLGALALLFVVSGLAMFLFGLVKLCSGKGSKKASKWSLFMFGLGVVIAGLVALLTEIDVSFLNSAESWVFGAAAKGGWTLWFAPAVFLIIYLFSFGTRRARPKD